jgi:RHS repeat-associated protein
MGVAGAGSWTDATNGVVNMGLRWYYPKVGRFLSSDPAAGSANPRTPVEGQRWLYVANSPLGNIDPSGLGCVWYDHGCHVENAISSAFNSASSAVISVYNAVNTASTGRTRR